MAPNAPHQSMGPDHRRVLKILAKAPRGRDVNVLLTRGFRFETLADLVRTGLVRVRLDTVKQRGQPVEVARLRITDDGREAIEG